MPAELIAPVPPGGRDEICRCLSVAGHFVCAAVFEIRIYVFHG